MRRARFGLRAVVRLGDHDAVAHFQQRYLWAIGE